MTITTDSLKQASPQEELTYELAILIRPQKNNETFLALTNQIKQDIEKETLMKIIKEEIQANKLLAYPVKPETSGTYLFLTIGTLPSSLEAIKKYLKENEAVLRFLMIKQTTKAKPKAKPLRAIKPKPSPEKIEKGPRKKIETPKEPKVSLEELDKKLDEILEGKI